MNESHITLKKERKGREGGRVIYNTVLNVSVVEIKKTMTKPLTL